ncbi:GSCFA domain-containing protein [Lacinutrix sp. Bg11-31]|uniref:GSCFA domain-containing protein n=1 Tax=Lacinutrix sp. Bg11-31 TaxID=2057808 RepID=UPI000C303E48|nr:GSCFA domain-containing protein [Lacinutrix sp. Bg11-31]AUC83428.1 GSCFA domain-containing protein [Lacinutrix sp. Bg11-31]
MKLQTQIKLKKQEHNLIDYNTKLLLLGSCFSENIGDKFEYYKFQSISNPFGILFHPKAIENLVIRSIQQKEYTEEDVFFHNDQWHCFDAHSKHSNVSKEKILSDLNTQIQLTNQQILESTHIIITLGTSWVYKLVESDKIVANCHKLPQKEFSKILLSTYEIKQSLQSIIEAIQSVNKNASIVFTVSPVRHIKDGFVENTLSKSHLISAIHQVTNNQVSYFSSFEIMLDELRDYRFYKSDMLHPNNTAVEYIWQKFQHVWMASESVKIMSDIDAIQKGLKHKPFNEKSEAHQKFLEQLERRKSEIQSTIKHLKF